MTWNPKVYLCASAAPFGDTDASMFLGYDYPNMMPEASLGGYPATIPAQRERLSSLFGFGGGAMDGGDSNPFLLRIFDDLSVADQAAGKTDYRALWFAPDIACTDVTVYIVTPRSTVGTISVWSPAPSTDANGNTYIQKVPSEVTAPAVAVWATPTSGAPLSLGAAIANQKIPLWIKRAIGGGASPYAYDIFKLVFADAAGNVFHVGNYYTFWSGLSPTLCTVTGANDGNIVTWPLGEEYVINTYNSSAAATDPPSSFVLARCSSTMGMSQIMAATGIRANGLPICGVVYAKKTATGVYRLDFKPPWPGHWQIEFDLGGEAALQRSVEVSPIS